MQLRHVLLIVFSCVVLQGCATLSKDECLSGDWYNIGKEDGSKGRVRDYINQHAQACVEYKVKPNVATYNKGRIEGLKIYCSPQNAFEVGKNLEKYSGVCPTQAQVEHNFLVTYVAGVERARARIGEELSDKDREVMSKQLSSTSKSKDKENEIAALQYEYKDLKKQKALADDLLAQYSRYRSPSMAEKLLKLSIETAVETATTTGVGKVFTILNKLK
jgi:hypothetical protein